MFYNLCEFFLDNYVIFFFNLNMDYSVQLAFEQLVLYLVIVMGKDFRRVVIKGWGFLCIIQNFKLVEKEENN